MSFAQKLKDRMNQMNLAKVAATIADDDIAEKRLSICKECPFFVSATSQCKKCGCFMQAKTRMSGAKCPISKW